MKHIHLFKILTHPVPKLLQHVVPFYSPCSPRAKNALLFQVNLNMQIKLSELLNPLQLSWDFGVHAESLLALLELYGRKVANSVSIPTCRWLNNQSLVFQCIVTSGSDYIRSRRRAVSALIFDIKKKLEQQHREKAGLVERKVPRKSTLLLCVLGMSDILYYFLPTHHPLFPPHNSSLYWNPLESILCV